MDSAFSAPGLEIRREGDQVVIRLHKDHVSPMLSVLMNSKFSEEQRLEFLTNPYVNTLIQALLPLVQREAPLSRERDTEPACLEKIRELVSEWAKVERRTEQDRAEIVSIALYPWATK